MYVARFEIEAGVFHVAAAELSGQPAAPLTPRPWLDALLGATPCGLALRLELQPDQAAARFLFNTLEPAPTPEQILTPNLTAPYEREGTRFANTPADFDRLTGSTPEYQLWVNGNGFHVNGRPVVPDFKLLPLLSRFASGLGSSTSPLVYQLNLRRLAVEPEDRRTVRKYLAGIELDSPFPTPMTNLQASLARRFLAAEFLSDELLATDDPSTFERALREIDQSFRATMQPFGFDKPPIEVGQFDDLFLSGLHSSVFGEPRDPLRDAAGSFTVAEVRSFFATPVPLPPPGLHDFARGGPTPVFISYASKDYVSASTVVGYLESQGIGCWVAPRNIRPGDPYPDAIIRALDATRAVVVLLSESSNLSIHVQREIERGLHRKALIIPLRIEDVRPTGTMEYLLALCQWIDAFDHRMDQALGELLDRLSGLFPAGAKA